ncbi:ameloblastin isoform X2 [Sorex araneus]|uniref:ameloblastin isoform X2 n=1 Tax=Sorex araneus TaxID=42254 RepID=UPI00243378F7|nr:ameloblastin isoform X2 [Sorex araneus]
MPALQIPLIKMKDLILILCLLEMSSAVPVFPKQAGIPGMASLSLETMRQLGSLQGLNMLSQYSKFGFGKSFNSLWLQGLLPPHSSFPWMRPKEHETQQPSLQPHQPGQKPFLPPTAATAVQNPAQKGGPQPPVYHHRQPPLQQAEGPMVQQQIAPSDMPPNEELPGMDFTEPRGPGMDYTDPQGPGMDYTNPQGPGMDYIDPQGPGTDFAEPQGPGTDFAEPQGPGVNFAEPQGPSLFHIARLISREPLSQNKPSSLYPGIYYMSYGANQLNAPGRIGFMSSEEMPGGRASPMTYGSMYSRLGGLRPNLAGMPQNQNPAKGGDFTLEFDTPVGATKGPEKGEGGPQRSPQPEAQRADPEETETRDFLPEAALGPLGGLLASPKDHIPSQARGPAGQNWGFPAVTADATDALMNPGIADIYETYGADMTTPPGLQGESTTDTTMAPDAKHTPKAGSKAQKPQISHDAWRFPEP